MLRLFSSVRKNLLAENKTVRYAKYAVGEVLLIMVGIMLALQFQNWNEGRKLEQQRSELIESLKADFRANLENINTSLPILEKGNERLRQFLIAISTNNNHLSVEELKDLAGSVYQSAGTRPFVSSYNTAVSTGTINLITNKSLAELFWEFENLNRTNLTLANMNRDDALVGTSAELIRQLGSITLLLKNDGGFRSNERPLDVPEIHKISDQEFREYITRKDVYAHYEARLSIRGRISGSFKGMKEIIEQILTALEELD